MTMLQSEPKSLQDLLVSITGTESSALSLDIAECNLICASEFPGVKPLDINANLARIDEMAHRVDLEIKRNYHHFIANPAHA